jgi:hypothetical protein
VPGKTPTQVGDGDVKKKTEKEKRQDLWKLMHGCETSVPWCGYFDDVVKFVGRGG